jgi:hypothetical protein
MVFRLLLDTGVKTGVFLDLLGCPSPSPGYLRDHKRSTAQPIHTRLPFDENKPFSSDRMILDYGTPNEQGKVQILHRKAQFDLRLGNFSETVRSILGESFRRSFLMCFRKSLRL